MKQKSNKHLIEGIVGLALIIGFGWLVLRGRDAAAPTDSSVTPQTQSSSGSASVPPASAPATNKLESTDSVAVSTQNDKAKIATIDNLNLSRPGFAVIGTANAGGKLAQVIGSSRLISPGEKQDLEIALTTALDSKVNYLVLLYHDNGDKKFDPKTDTLLNNKTATATFIAR